MKSKLTLFLPGLFKANSKQSNLQQNSIDQSLLGFRTLFSRANCQQSSLKSTAKCMQALFKGLANQQVPYAALSAYYFGLVTAEQQHNWCFATPVECLIDHRTAYLVGSEHLRLAPTDQVAIINEINALLLEDNGVILPQPDTAMQWYYRMPIGHHANILMNDLPDCLGRSIGTLLPSGPDQSYWRRLLSECQMILMASKARIPHSISSLWFWGMGELPTNIQTDFEMVYSTNTAILGLAQLAQVPCQSMPITKFSQYKNSLWVDFAFANGWDQAILAQYEDSCFGPILTALKNKELDILEILCADGRRWTLTRKHLAVFWRKIKKISDICND